MVNGKSKFENRRLYGLYYILLQLTEGVLTPPCLTTSLLPLQNQGAYGFRCSITGTPTVKHVERDFGKAMRC